MIGVPAAANILFLVPLFEDLGNFRIPVHVSEKTVDIDIAKFFGKGDLIVRREFLIPEI